MATKAKKVPTKNTTVKKQLTAKDAQQLSVDCQDKALDNILGLVSKAASNGYICIFTDPISDFITVGLKGLGFTVDAMHVATQGRVRISW